MGIALMGTTSFAGWQRTIGGTGNLPVLYSPPSHSLAYFLVDPCLRPDTDALVRARNCNWPGIAPSPDEVRRRASTRAELKEVGKIREFTIYDLWYSTGEDHDPGDPSLRSVLVKTATDQYREVNVAMRWGREFPASEIVNLDGEPILIARWNNGANASRTYDTLYMFPPSGSETPDFKAVDEAAAKLKPANMSVYWDKNNYALLTYTAELYTGDVNLPRIMVREHGLITITYRFVDGRAIVTSSKFEPYSQ